MKGRPVAECQAADIFFSWAARRETLREPAHRELWIEVLHENLWRLLLDWPVALGLSPAKDDFIA